MTGEWVLDEGDIHDVLRNERRRHTLELLRDNGETSSVRDLSEEVAALETGESPPPRNIRQSVYVSLHQTHLPKLDDLGIAVYDADAKRVTLTDRVGEVEAYMGRPAGSDGESGRRSTRYVLVLSAVGLVAMVAVTLDSSVIAAIGVPLAVLLFAAVLALSVRQLRSEGSRDDSDTSGPFRSPRSESDADADRASNADRH
jgi:hypothetical protein